MSDNPTSPLLGTNHDEARRDIESTRYVRPSSPRSAASNRSRQDQNSIDSHESTPLLSRNADNEGYNGIAGNRTPSSPAASSLRSLQDGGYSKSKSRIRWPTFVALSCLTLVVLVILGLGFATPAMMEEYAKEAMVFKPVELSIDSFTLAGVKARVRGEFSLEASKVQKKPVRDLGRFATWIARAVESKPTKIMVYLPENGNVLIGTIAVPAVVVDIRDGWVTYIDVVADLRPGEDNGIQNIAKIATDWAEGRLGRLRIKGQADVDLKSGVFSLGTKSLAKTMLLEGSDFPTIPNYNITKFNLHEVELFESNKGMQADASISLMNDYPVTFTVPPLGFEILVPGCPSEGSQLLLANATTHEISVKPKEAILVRVNGIIRHLDETLISNCPQTDKSPLDFLLGEYISGVDTTVFVRGADAPSGDTPSWISELIKDVMVPLPFPGHTFDSLIRNFSMTDVHLGLPSPFAEPNTPEASPKISAVVHALVNLPKEMNFPVNVSHVRAVADVFYLRKKLGVLDLHKWQVSNSTRIDANGDEPAGLAVSSVVKNAPLNVTDNGVFSDVVQAMLFGGKSVVLGVEAKVDVETETALGVLVVRDLPAEGQVPIKPLLEGGFEKFSPKVGSLKILDTDKSMILLEAKVNLTNPTNYSATVPYVNINLLSNGTQLGFAVAEGVSISPGENKNILVHATWDPLSMSGKHGLAAGKELLSQYISGYNTSITLQTHKGTIPSMPRLGKVLSSFAIDIPTPRLVPPKNPNRPDDGDDGDGDRPHFIDDATMHLFSSTATFTLLSPLQYSTLFITHINATALYNHTDPIGLITYDLPFAVPPGATTSPKLPVDWSLGSVGYEAVKQALGGTLKLDAKATVGVRLGNWEETVWFEGTGIGAHVRI